MDDKTKQQAEEQQAEDTPRRRRRLIQVGAPASQGRGVRRLTIEDSISEQEEDTDGV